MDLVTAKERVIQKLYEYPKIKQKIKLLRFELENHKPVSAEDMLETMCFAKGDGTGHNSGAVSNRTLYIAMNYQCAADAANSESSKEILNRLIPLEKEASRIEYYLSFLQENEKTVIRLLYFERHSLSETGEIMSSSIWCTRKVRDEGIGRLVEMYDFINDQ